MIEERTIQEVDQYIEKLPEDIKINSIECVMI